MDYHLICIADTRSFSNMMTCIFKPQIFYNDQKLEEHMQLSFKIVDVNVMNSSFDCRMYITVDYLDELNYFIGL